jgi:2-dehydro-3-deoxyphosphogalactonate aldolase
MSRNLIGILRGVRPDEVVEIAAGLLEAGIACIEVPLNSPEPMDSIRRLVERFGGQGEFGAGTVLSIADVEQVASTGATLIVSPNCNPEVIRASKRLGLTSCPGVLTPSECFAALEAGADVLKIFPAEMMGRNGLKAIRAVLPPATQVYAVGGAGADNFGDWLAAGATGFGIGSALYKPGLSAADIAERARIMVAAYDAAGGPQ